MAAQPETGLRSIDEKRELNVTPQMHIHYILFRFVYFLNYIGSRLDLI